MDRVKIILISFILSIVFAITSFLSISFFNGFVSKADYNKDMSDISVIKVDIIYLKNGQKEIKDMIRDTKMP